MDRISGGVDEADRLHVVLLRLGRRLRAIDAGTGFTPAELSVLAVVVRCGPIRPSELARREGLNPTMLSRLLAHLVEDGAIGRRDDPADRRLAPVMATARGRRLHRQLRTERARALGGHVDRLGPDERRAILAALPALEALVDVIDGNRR